MERNHLLKVQYSPKLIAQNIKTLIAIKGIKQDKLASKLGISETSLYFRLIGKNKWTVPEMVVLSRLFEIKIDDLLFYPLEAKIKTA